MLSFFVLVVFSGAVLAQSGAIDLYTSYKERQNRIPRSLTSDAKLPIEVAADVKNQEAPIHTFDPEQLEKLKADREKLEQGVEKDQTRVKKLDEQRTEYVTTWENADGSRTQEVSTQATSYKDASGKWQDVDMTLEKQGKEWRTKANSWQASFSNSREGLKIKKNGQTFTMAPVGDNIVEPEVSGEAPNQLVTYENVWDGVDISYSIAGSQVKENIIIHRNDVDSSFKFTIDGSKLIEKETKGNFKLDGEFAEFEIAPAVVFNKDGRAIRDEFIVSQVYDGASFLVNLNTDWLTKQSADAFPIVIDPTVYYVNSDTNAFTTTSTAPTSGCTAGPTCPNIIGHDNIGNIDYRFGYQVTVPTPPLPARDYLHSAVLHLEMAVPPVGITGSEQVTVTRASCIGFNCIDTSLGTVTGTVTTAADIDVVSIYRKAVLAGENNPYLLVRGEEGGTVDKYKEFDYTKTKVTFTYQTLPNQSLISTGSSITVPADNGVAVTTQPTLASTVPSDDGPSSELRYRYIVGTTKGAIQNNPLNIVQTTGTIVVDSGTLTQPQWVLPDNVLRDGTTYYWQALVWDGYSNNPVPWVHSPVYSFKVDLRNGKDATQPVDEFGPVGVDLVTGNATTGAVTHGISALGGTLSLGLEYNSPLRSREGLVGQYYNSNDLTGSPVLTRVEPNVLFEWGAGSPYTGLVNTDNFSARWTGYFIAPANGTYQFGSTSDNGSRIFLNSSTTAYLDQWNGLPVQAYGATGIALTAGQVLPIKYEYRDTTGNAKAEMWVKTTDGTTVTPRVIPSSMLQTGAKPIAEPKGLVGRYYTDPGGAHTFPTNQDDPTRLFLTRTDTSLNQHWGESSPVPGGPVNNFMVRWTGQLRVPTSGTYKIGVGSDDGARVYINGNLVTNAWSDHGATPVVYGSEVSLTANTPVNIQVEYYENGGGAQFGLFMRPSTFTAADLPVDSTWLLPQAEVLPNGWGISLDGDGSLSYAFASINSGGVTLYDASGQTHEWKFVNNAFVPPAGETGHMVRNGDGTVTLQDEDGQTYIFAANGSIKSVTRPSDDRNPAALQYIYQSVNNNPARLTQISDPVSQTNINDASTASRWLRVYYGQDATNCPAVPSGQGFLAITDPKHQYVCGVKTSDGRTTALYYKSSLNGAVLSRMVLPGNESTDYGYSTDGMLTSLRGSLANDAIAAGVRTQDVTVETAIAYDSLYRASGVTLPAATAGAVRLAHTYEYRPLSSTSLMHVTNATQPNGFSRKVEYDALYRTIKDTNSANLTTETEWDTSKDLVKSTKDPLGMRSTIHYDYADRPTDNYGPAPNAWFDLNTASANYNKPLTTPTNYLTQAPRSQTIYEEGINGLSAAYHDVTTATNGTGASTKVLFGNPKLHTTGIGPVSGDVMRTWGTAAPITPITGNGWGVSLTGWIRLSSSGNYSFRVRSDDGARLWIGDTVVTDDWTDGVLRNHSTNAFSPNVFNNTQGDKWYRVRLDYYNRNGTSDAQLELYMTPPSGAETSALGSLLKPNYGLVTTSKTFDSNTSVGDRVVSTNYGANPELGLAQSSTIDPTGLALTTTSIYEAQDAGSFLRQLSNTIPGGATTSYSYYTSTDKKDDPCTPAVEAYGQAGRLKVKTEPDPDAGGSQTPITTETIYDDTGRVVATRFNTETSWTCYTYDARSRLTQKVIPSNENGPARTITHNYAVGGNPLISEVRDPSTVEVTIDLLGRTVGYRDALSYTFTTGQTVSSYDNIGRLISRNSPKKGLEEFTYDNFNRLTNHKLAGTTYATVSYDSFSRVSQVTYPAAGSQKLVFGRDALQRVNSKDYTLGNGTTHTIDTVNYSQSGAVVSGTERGQAKAYTYDKAGRLLTGTLATNTFGYSYAAPSAATCNQASANLNAHKSSNRTSQTVNGSTTTYCYDKADRLISSSDTAVTDPEYDTHGNTEQLGLSSNPAFLQFFTDSSDRNTGYRQNWGTDYNVQINYDSLDRTMYRGVTGLTTSNSYFSYTTSSSSPDMILNTSAAVVEKYMSLPGGVLLTIKSGTTRVYSLPNIHGDIFQTTTQSGTSIAAFNYEPYGKLMGTTTPTNMTAGSATFGHVGQHQKISDAKLTLQPQQMGARIYMPTLGRFTQVDPVYGGTANNYVYVNDPVNQLDLTGMIGWKKWISDHGVDIAITTVGIVGCAVTAGVGCAVVSGVTAVASVANSYRTGGFSGGGQSAFFEGVAAIAGSRLKLVRDFGKVASKTRYYKSAISAFRGNDGFNNQAVRRLGKQAGLAYSVAAADKGVSAAISYGKSSGSSGAGGGGMLLPAQLFPSEFRPGMMASGWNIA